MLMKRAQKGKRVELPWAVPSTWRRIMKDSGNLCPTIYLVPESRRMSSPIVSSLVACGGLPHQSSGNRAEMCFLLYRPPVLLAVLVDAGVQTHHIYFSLFVWLVLLFLVLQPKPRTLPLDKPLLLKSTVPKFEAYQCGRLPPTHRHR